MYRFDLLRLLTLFLLPSICEANGTESDRRSCDGGTLPPHEWDALQGNQWHSYNGWRRNSPAGRQYAAATSVRDYKPDGTSREVMVMYGGELYSPDNATWIYDPKSNSWESVAHRSQPIATAHHTLVTLCQRRVLLFGGSAYRVVAKEDECSNETWMFDVTRKEWTIIETIIHPHSNDSYVTPRCMHAATVVQFENSSCRCKESMLIYSGLRRKSQRWSSPSQLHLGDMWLLSCKDSDSYVYEWIRLRPLGRIKPELRYPRAVSAFHKTVMYLLGVSPPYAEGYHWQVWSYHLPDSTWRKVGNSAKLASVPGHGVYITNHNQSYHFLVSCCPKPLIVFDIMRKLWFHPQQMSKGQTPDLFATTAAVCAVGDSILSFGGSNLFFGFNQVTMWNLTVRSPHMWVWSVRPALKLSPLKGRIFSVGGIVERHKRVLLFGGVIRRQGSKELYLDNELYILNLTTFQWSMDVSETRPPFAASATAVVLHDSVFVVYGGLLISKHVSATKAFSVFQKAWGYYSQVGVWVEYLTKGSSPSSRAFHCSVATDDHTMMIYGGVAIRRGLRFLNVQLTGKRDLWSFTLPPQDNDTFNVLLLKHQAQWHLVDGKGPAASFGASLVVFGNKLFLYGGSTISKESVDLAIVSGQGLFKTVFLNCSNGLWEYELLESTGWRQVQYARKGPGRRCHHDALTFGKHVIVVSGCSNHVRIRINLATLLWQYDCPSDRSTSGVWLYNPITNAWLRLNHKPSAYLNGIFSLNLLWNDWILSFGGLTPPALDVTKLPGSFHGFSVFRPSCPAGTISTDLMTHMCSDCPFGYYAALPRSNCSRCPHGLTTPQSGATATVNCSECLPGYCGYGSCTVTLQGPSPSCTCQFGFTKSDDGLCTVPTYYVAASGFVAGVGLLMLVVVLAVKSRKARKRHNAMLRNKDHQLMELTNSWNVDSREIRLRRRIDRDAPGGFGEVYKAKYRDITVAVKKLKGIHQHIDRIELEFEREIEVMRTIRHPNIVLFLGGGRYHGDGCPFLVVEYMPRGSLAAILRSNSIELEDSLKLRFTVDAAKGMRFLHGQRPPRVHRDLKSGNLLVSQRWVVKVADFGAARLVRDEGIKQEAVRGGRPLDLTAPLLHADYQLSSGIGTPKWSAPEILCGDGYGTPADVYSFGIVMWEIWSRKVPYDDRFFESILDLKSAVLSGIRPTVPDYDREDYVKIMCACWSGIPSCRPTFRDIVVQLEEINERYVLVSRNEGRNALIDSSSKSQ